MLDPACLSSLGDYAKIHDLLNSTTVDRLQDEVVRKSFIDAVIAYHEVVQATGQAVGEQPLKVFEFIRLAHTLAFRQIAVKKNIWNFFEAELRSGDPHAPMDRITFVKYASAKWQAMRQRHTDDFPDADWQQLCERYDIYVRNWASEPLNQRRAVAKGMRLIQKVVCTPLLSPTLYCVDQKQNEMLEPFGLTHTTWAYDRHATARGQRVRTYIGASEVGAKWHEKMLYHGVGYWDWRAWCDNENWAVERNDDAYVQASMRNIFGQRGYPQPDPTVAPRGRDLVRLNVAKAVRQFVRRASPLRHPPECTRLPPPRDYDVLLRRKWRVGLYVRRDNDAAVKRRDVVDLRASLRSPRLGLVWGETVLKLLGSEIVFSERNPWDQHVAVDGPSSDDSSSGDSSA